MTSRIAGTFRLTATLALASAALLSACGSGQSEQQVAFSPAAQKKFKEDYVAYADAFRDYGVFIKNAACDKATTDLAGHECLLSVHVAHTRPQAMKVKAISNAILNASGECRSALVAWESKEREAFEMEIARASALAIEENDIAMELSDRLATTDTTNLEQTALDTCLQ
jgi:hypothetical protein